MDFNRATLIVVVLLLALFLEASSGFATIGAVQDQIRDIQLKLIGEKLKLLQKQVLQVKTVPEPPMVKEAPSDSAVPTAEELSKALQGQIAVLENIVKGLRPKALEEETLRLEKRIVEINEALRFAKSEKVEELQNELAVVLNDYQKLQQGVKALVEDAITSRQAVVLREQIQTIQQKLNLLKIQEKAASGLPPAKPAEEDRSTINYLQDSLEKVKLKLLQAQIKAVQEKISQLQGNR